MEQRGVLKSWNDDKGFGFIQPETGGEPLFAHISAMRGERRPQAGETLLFIAERDPQGRLRARHMRLEALSLDRLAIRRKPRPGVTPADKPARRERPPRAGSAGIRNWPLKLALLLGLCVLPLAGAWRMLQLWGLVWPLAAYALASLVSFFQYWHDKRRAEQREWRIPESTLHAVELFGGWPGALLAQQVFRHKTRKVSYQVVFWGIVLLHQALWCDWLWLGGRYGGAWLALLGGGA